MCQQQRLSIRPSPPSAKGLPPFVTSPSEPAIFPLFFFLSLFIFLCELVGFNVVVFFVLGVFGQLPSQEGGSLPGLGTWPPPSVPVKFVERRLPGR